MNKNRKYDIIIFGATSYTGVYIFYFILLFLEIYS